MNNYREPEQKPSEPESTPARPAAKSKKFARRIQKVLNGEFLTNEGLINHLPFIGFLVGLFLIYISLMYFYESTEREIVKAHKELNEINADYKSTASALEMRSQQSQVAVDISNLGLEEVRTPSNIIDVEKGFLSEDK